MKIFYILWGLPQLLCYLYYCKRIPEIVEDLKSFTNSGGGGGVNSFLSQLPKREYRSVFYYSMPFVIRQLLNLTMPRARNCYLSTANIGGGLHLQHGYSLILVAEHVGKNLQVHQNVTVGWGKNGKPTIGDNVSIFPGAVVAGKIKIGNNVRIAANTVVRHDVPDNCLVYGNPCVIKYKK